MTDLWFLIPRDGPLALIRSYLFFQNQLNRTNLFCIFSM